MVTVTLDWLEFMVSGHLVHYDSALPVYEYQNGRVKLILQRMATRHFKYQYEAWIEGKLFATINCCPRSKEILREDSINVKIENPRLYEVDVVKEVKRFFNTMRWSVKNVTRMDIALDGVDVLNLGNRFMKGLIGKKGKSRNAFYMTSKNEMQGYDVGRRSSDRWITCYCKSAELEVSNKNYIRDFWERSGLMSERVERFELKLRNEAIKMIKGFDWQRLDDFEYLASICRTQTETIFFFHELSKDSNITRAKKIEWINWDEVGAKQLEKLKARESNEVYRLKNSAKTLYWLFLATKEDRHFQIMLDIVENINCMAWYLKKVERWKREFEDKYCDSEGVTRFDFLSIWQTYKHGEQLELYAK